MPTSRLPQMLQLHRALLPANSSVVHAMQRLPGATGPIPPISWVSPQCR